MQQNIRQQTELMQQQLQLSQALGGNEERGAVHMIHQRVNGRDQVLILVADGQWQYQDPEVVDGAPVADDQYNTGANFVHALP